MTTKAQALELYDAAANLGDHASADAWRTVAAALRSHLVATVSRRALEGAPKAAKPLAYTMEAASLAKALRLACKVAQRRSTIPILACVLLTATGDALRITATDLDQEIAIDVAAPGVGVWRVAVGAHELLAIVAKAPKGAAITLAGELGPEEEHHSTVKGEKVVKIGRPSVLKIAAPGPRVLHGPWASDFPAMTFPGAEAVTMIDAAPLADAFAFVRHAVSNEETRFYLNGIHLHAGKGAEGVRFLHAVGCDGRRVGKVEIAGAPDADLSCIIPRLTVDVMREVLGPGAVLAIGATKCQLVAGPVVITSKLVDGSFPDYERVIPRDGEQAFTVDRAAFAAAVASVASICTDRGRSVHFVVSKDSLEIKLRNMEGGQACETIPCDYQGAGFETGYNAKYVAEAMAAFKGERVTFTTTGGGTILDAAVITDGTPDRLLVLMPLRVL